MPIIGKVLARTVGGIAVAVALTTLPGAGSALLAASNGDIHIGSLTSVCGDPKFCPQPEAGSTGDVIIGSTVLAGSNGDILIGSTAVSVCPDPKDCPSPGIGA